MSDRKVFFFFSPPVLLRYNGHTALYKFKVSSIVMGLPYIMKWMDPFQEVENLEVDSLKSVWALVSLKTHEITKGAYSLLDYNLLISVTPPALFSSPVTRESLRTYHMPIPCQLSGTAKPRFLLRLQKQQKGTKAGS